MTREDIIRMAREAGGLQDGLYFDIDVHSIEHFAALVAAAEREACAVVAFNEAYSDEEACHIAEAIRARGQA